MTALEPKEPSLPLGLGDLAGPVVPVDRYDLPPGATLVLFTDGIIEARDRTGAFFDPVPRSPARCLRTLARYWTPCWPPSSATPTNSGTTRRPWRSPASRTRRRARRRPRPYGQNPAPVSRTHPR